MPNNKMCGINIKDSRYYIGQIKEFAGIVATAGVFALIVISMFVLA